MFNSLSIALLAVIFTVSSAMADTAKPSFKRVMMVVFENTNYSVAYQQPYFAKLANEGALFTQFYAEKHPSQPNYIAMISGSTQGVKDDGSVDLDAEHIGNLLEKKGLSWKVYAEDLPEPCYLGTSHGLYARKHVPFLSFTNVSTNMSECIKVVAGTQLKSDIITNSVPAFSMYIPNLKNDGHDTGAKYAAQWFSDNFGGILNNSEFMKDTLMVITFDESGSLLGKNQIYTVLYGANVKPGAVVSASTNHYSILKMIEDRFELGNLGNNDADASEITEIWL